MMSSTTSPSLTSTAKSSRPPPSASPRHTRNCASYPMSGPPPRMVRQFGVGVILFELADLEQLQQVRAHRYLRFGGDGHIGDPRIAAGGAAHEQRVAPLRVHVRVG